MKRISKEEADSLLEAMDFVSSNSGSATDQEYYEGLQNRLHSLWKKLKEDQQRQSNKRSLAMAKRMVAKELKRRAAEPGKDTES